MSMEVVRECLADYAHETWCGWMGYLFQHGTFNPDGTFTIDAEHVIRWNRQIKTPYQLLSESEKESDRAEANHILRLIGAI